MTTCLKVIESQFKNNNSELRLAMSLTKKNRPIGPKEIKNENPEIKQTPEIIRVIQFRQIGGNLAKA